MHGLLCYGLIFYFAQIISSQPHHMSIVSKEEIGWSSEGQPEYYDEFSKGADKVKDIKKINVVEPPASYKELIRPSPHHREVSKMKKTVNDDRFCFRGDSCLESFGKYIHTMQDPQDIPVERFGSAVVTYAVNMSGRHVDLQEIGDDDEGEVYLYDDDEERQINRFRSQADDLELQNPGKPGSLTNEPPLDFRPFVALDEEEVGSDAEGDPIDDDRVP